MITTLTDERRNWIIRGKGLDARVYDSLRTAISRAEKAEAALCRARDRVIDALNRNQAPMPACQDVVDALMKGYSPCPHEEEVKRLREAVEWACDHKVMNHHGLGPCKGGINEREWAYFADELRRRAKEGG